MNNSCADNGMELSAILDYYWFIIYIDDISKLKLKLLKKYIIINLITN